MTDQLTVAASDGHRNFGKLLRRVYTSNEHLVVERDGFPVAVLLSYQEYQRITGQRQPLPAAQASPEMRKDHVDVEQVMEQLSQGGRPLDESRVDALADSAGERGVLEVVAPTRQIFKQRYGGLG